MSELGFSGAEVEDVLNDSHARPTARVERDIAFADRLGVQFTPTFVVILGANPPVSANHRMLGEILNSPGAEALLAQD